jgi:hypothetical protein
VPQFPDWRQQVATWTEAAQSFASDVAARGRRVPESVLEQLRKRVNVLGLATKNDVELQSRIARKRVSVALKEFTEAQRSHDQQLVEMLRAELHEEFQGLIQALDDEILVDEALDPLESMETARRRRSWSDLDDLDDPDDLDLLALEALDLAEE